jgi:hypothetical protein
MLYVVNFTSGDESTDPFGGSGEGYYDATLSANGSCGTLITIPPTVATSNANGVWFSEQESGTYIVCALQGDLTQSFFSEMSIQLSGEVDVGFFSNAANCIFSTSSLPGFSVWEFPVSGGLDFPFENGHNYPVTFTVTANSLPNAMFLSAEAVSNSEIDLSWTDSNNSAYNYNLARDNVVIAHVANDIFSYADTGLSPDTTYMYAITGVDGSNNAVYLTAYANATTETNPVAQSVNYLSEYNSGPFLTANGDVNINGSIYTYFEGTLTPCNTYTDITGLTLNPNPIVVNTNGMLPNQIWVPVGQNVHIQMYDSVGNIIDDKDHISPVPYIPGGLNQVYVIDSIFSTDTANAASANAVNWVYKVANGAYGYANTVGNNTLNAVNTAANTCSFYANGILVLANSDLNFNNSASINCFVTSNASGNLAQTMNQVNVAFSVNIAGALNVTSQYATANFSQRVANTLFQWGNFTCVDGTVTVYFKQPFSNAAQTAVTVTWAYTSPDAGFVQSGSVTDTSFNYTNGNAGECYYHATGPA